MNKRHEQAYTFGNHTPYIFKRLSVGENKIEQSLLALERPRINRDSYLKNLEDANVTWQVLVDPKTSRQFEAAITNASADATSGIDAELSTFTSSISGNIGNAVEFAEHGALHPNRQRLYIASFGNGMSSYWDTNERNYVKRTGRFVQPNGDALPTIAALERALSLSGFAISRISANSAGGAHATALMSALPEGQVTHCYMKSRPNISNHPSGLLWGLNVLVGDILDDKKYKEISEDPWKLTTELESEARALMSRVYSNESTGQWTIPNATRDHGVGKLWTDMTAFSRGGHRFDYPASTDTAAALAKQPGALLTYHFPAQDRLYRNQTDISVFLEQARSLGKAATGQVQALLAPGAYRDHTQYPGLRWAAEKYSFSR